MTILTMITHPTLIHGKAVAFATALLMLVVQGHAQDMATLTDTLTVDNAVAIALQNHFAIKAAQANVVSAEAGKRVVVSTYLPAIGFSASSVHTEGTFVFNPSIASKYQIYSNYTAGLTASQLIYDFGKTTNRISANTDFVTASKEDFRTARDNVITNVEVAFLTYLEDQDVVKVTLETIAQAESHLKSAKAFYSVGTRPLLDVTRSEVDLANANVASIRAKNQMEVARLQLENAMGIHPDHPYVVYAAVTMPPMTITLDSARSQARSNRPDILAAQSRYDALSSLASSAWDQHLPTLSANGTWNWSGFDVTLYGRWSAGLTFSFPIFQGFGISAAAQQASANAEAQQAALVLTIENALLDVEQNYLAVNEANERYGASVKLVEEAEASLTLAEKQYSAGVGTLLDVTDAQVLRANARITQIQALYDYNNSLVRLKMAMGAMSSDQY